jgi:hypothetical protein
MQHNSRGIDHPPQRGPFERGERLLHQAFGRFGRGPAGGDRGAHAVQHSAGFRNQKIVRIAGKGGGEAFEHLMDRR